MTYTHHIRVRYGEVDMQRVVSNAHYLAYCDDAADLWYRSLGAGPEDDRAGTTETKRVPDGFRAAAGGPDAT